MSPVRWCTAHHAAPAPPATSTVAASVLRAHVLRRIHRTLATIPRAHRVLRSPHVACAPDGAAPGRDRGGGPATMTVAAFAVVFAVVLLPGIGLARACAAPGEMLLETRVALALGL